MRRLIFLAALATAVLCATASSVAADTGQATVERFYTEGIAQSFFGECDFSTPPGPLTCHETLVVVFKEIFKEASGSPDWTAPSKTPWIITIDDYDVSYASGGPDAVPVFSNERSGLLVGPTVTFDQQHLSSLGADARVPMSDGSTFDFHGTWAATSDLSQFGNDGPSLADFGRTHHYVDACTTINSQAHQKFRSATMTGTLNGAPVHSYRNLDIDFLAYNHFVYVAVTHGDCA
jgi:hypothetical protein